MAMRAFSTLGCPELSLAAVLSLAARRGMDGVELRALEGTVELPALFADRFGSPSAFAAQLSASPVRVVSLDSSFRMISASAEDRRKLLDYVPWAEAAGIRWLRVFDGGKSGDEGELAEAAATLRWWQEQRGEAGWSVDLMIETHDCLAEPAALARFVEQLPNCPVLWDTHHTWRKGGVDPVTTWPLVRSQPVHVHVKDSISRPGRRPLYSYVLPGQGEFPMAQLLSQLHADGFAGVLSLEWEKLWHPELATLDAALEEASRRVWW